LFIRGIICERLYIFIDVAEAAAAPPVSKVAMETTEHELPYDKVNEFNTII
jgi:hypothetical protein